MQREQQRGTQQQQGARDGGPSERRSLLPAPSMPKGGGAIRGIGEKFGVNPVTGTGSLSVPLVSSAGRDGFGPQLSIAYDSGSGNGPFGFGWGLSLPAITRKTDKGLARYADDAESDVFLLAGSEDLVPILDAGNNRAGFNRTLHGKPYRVRLYRPRIEGLFARIERWTDTATGISHWRTISRDNVVTMFGADDNSRIRDPADPRRVHSWLMAWTADNKGNLTSYEYVPEDSTGVATAAANEAHRTPASRGAQRYLKYVRYANATPWFPNWTAGGAQTAFPAKFHFTLAFDYGDHDSSAPTPARTQPWPVRPDPFSSYKPGFEVRTYRRCRRALLFHDFPAEATIGADALVRSIDLTYADDVAPPDPSLPIYSYVRSVEQAGYVRTGTTYKRRAMPPLEFEYSEPTIDPRIFTLTDPESEANLPEGIDGSRFRWIDLDGEGLSGILTDEEGGWQYKRNLSPLNRVPGPDAQDVARARFGPAEPIDRLPVPGLSGGQQFLDLDGNGQLELVALGGPNPGYRERTADADWGPFRCFDTLPAINWSEPNLQFVDVTGDGLADALITEGDAFTLYRSLGLKGFAAAERVPAPTDEERGAQLVYADGTSSIFFADMSGGGLRDLVRVRNGEVCYWPSLGYGRFGAKVTMDRSPRFDRDEQFDAKRIRLADIDGSGSTDILYVGTAGVQLHFNQSGNAWAHPRLIAVFPDASNLSSVQVTDLLGNGTSCLVWSSQLPAEAPPLRYVDLMGSQKPHLLVAVRNNLGAETRLRYAPSTRFYLEDRAAGRPWATRLPFPVHVVEHSESYDWIGRSRSVSRYAYHHGYFDGAEREFRGFGMVEQWDTQVLRDDTLFPQAQPANEEAASLEPPTLTRTWFHTGAFADAATLARAYARDYWVEPALRGDAPAAIAGRAALLLPDSWIDPGLTPAERREACRALKGSPLRVEVFGLDGTAAAEHPFTVKQQNYGVRRVQGFGPNKHASLLTFGRETVTHHYERDPEDPRVAHEVTLAVDPFGNVTLGSSVAYPRRPGFDPPEPDLSADFVAMLQHDQTRLHIGATGHGLTDPIGLPEQATPLDAFRGPMPSETLTAELTGFAPAGARFGFDELKTRVDTLWLGASDIPYEEVSTPDIEGIGIPIGLARRIVGQSRVFYRSDTLAAALLPQGTAGTLGLPGESYNLAFTPGLISRIFNGKVTAVMLAEGGFVQLAGSSNWWAPSGRIFYSPGPGDTPAAELAEARAHFFRPRRSFDPFGAIEQIDFDAYDLLPVRSTDANGNTNLATNDYRVLSPVRSIGPNGNFRDAIYDTLGQVAGAAVHGKAGEGDNLTDFVADLTPAELTALLADPLAAPGALLGNSTARIVYDHFAYHRTRASATPDPPMVYTLSRETHVSDLPAGEESRYQHRFAYSDGFGHEIQHKAPAEPGPVPGLPGTVSPRWTGSGWTILNNKGKPVRRYEPFFSDTHRFEFNSQHGAASVLFYDASERNVAVLRPDATFDMTVFTGWAEWDWDSNDTSRIDDPRIDVHVGDYFRRLLGNAPGAFTSWYQARIGGSFGATAEERAANKDAAEKAEAHAATPTAKHYDTLGRTCLTVRDNGEVAGVAQRYATRTAMDTESKPLVFIDPLGRHVSENCRREPIGGGGSGFRYVAGYDMLGKALFHATMDGGAELTLTNVAGKVIRHWDAGGNAFRTAYDVLQRPTHHYVDEGAGELLSELLVYGDHHPDASLNLKGKLFRHYDGAGLSSHERCDFKTHAVSSARQLAVAYRTAPDWTPLGTLGAGNPLDVTALDTAGAALLVTGDRFVSHARFDALDRPTQTVLPHATGLPASVVQPAYNEANLLESLAVWVRATAVPGGLLDPTGADIPAVMAVEYNEHGQRTRIAHGNGAVTSSVYDPLTKRLMSLTTTRPHADPQSRTVQALSYSYDPHGNVTRIRDDADIHNVVYFKNQRVDPTADYTYDPIYRLVSASGREHLGLTGAGGLKAPLQVGNDDGSRTGIGHPGNGNAVGTYTESYGYDPAGNLLEMVHLVSSGNWTRRYAYDEASRITAGETCNRLSATSAPGDPGGGPYTDRYSYDDQGNMTAMPHLPAMRWDARDRLQSTTRQVVVAGTPETTYYAYDAGGDRVRKVTERQAAAKATPTRKNERIYLGGAEIYREYAADGTTVTLARESLDVLLDHRRLAVVETRFEGVDPGPGQLVRYQFGNHLGSASLELDPAADLISYEEYFPYGATSYQAVRSALETPKRYRYSGKERDEENDLSYHGERYYAPWLGRWTACDPTGAADGPNLYMYVHGNPVAFSDPTGMWGWRQVAIIAAVVVVGTVVTVATAGVAGPIIAGAVASVGLSGAAATVATGVVVGAVAGAAGGAASELTRQVASGEQVSARRVGRAALEGAAMGAVTGGLSAAATTVRGAAAISRASTAIGQSSAGQAAAAGGRAVAAGARAVARVPGVRQAVQAGSAVARGGGRVIGAIEQASTRVGQRAANAAFGQGAGASRTAAVAARAAPAARSPTPVSATDLGMSGAARYQRARALVAEAQEIAGIGNLSRYVTHVTSRGSTSYFYAGRGGERVLNVGAEALAKSTRGALVDVVHELTHARQFASLLARRGGNLRRAVGEIGRVNAAGDAYLQTEIMPTAARARALLLRYATFERHAEATAIRQVNQYFGGVSQRIQAASARYINSWTLR